MSTVESQSSRSSSSHYDSNSRREKSKRGETPNHHSNREGYNSSIDPSVKSTHGEKTSSNARHHPKAETTPTNMSNHTYSKSHDRKRKPSNEDTEDVWTEHKSSSGRIYFYNKRLDKSQWEKPTKGTVKKLRQTPDPRMSSSANKSSTAVPSKSHSHTTGTHSHTTHSHAGTHSHTAGTHSGTHSHTNSTHHRDGSSNSSSNHYHYDHHTPKRKISDRKYSSSFSSPHSKSLKNTPETPIGNDKTSNVLSPTTLPPPPPPPLPHNTTPTQSLPSTDLSSPHILPYMVNESIGPTTPLQTYPGGWVPVSTEGTPHPLQRTIMIQPQFSQGPQGSPRSLPTTPLQSFPPPTHIITTNNNNTLHSGGNHGYVTTPIYCYDSQQRPCSSKKLQLPMSRLGAWPPKDDTFPDPSLLKPLPQLQSNDFYSNSLTLQWTSSIDATGLKQADSAQLESLSRTTVDLSYHCGQLVRNLLALECCRMKTVSRRTRITNLTNTIDQIDKR